MSLLCVATLGAGFAVQSLALGEEGNVPASAQSNLRKMQALFNNDLSQYYDKNVVFKLPETVAEDEEISVIVKLSEDSLMDSFKGQNKYDTVAEYVDTRDARILASRIEDQQKDWFNRLRNSGFAYEIGEKYDTILNGFEIIIKASEFEKANKFFGDKATLIIGDEYEPAQTEPIHNDVDVYDTGIFDSSSSEYQGDGVVVAVLDTGLDYTHTAFLVENFTTSNEAFTLNTVSSKVSKTAARRRI